MMLIYSFLMWAFFLHKYLIVANSLILIPQIIHNISSSQNCTFSPNLFLFSVSKFLIFYFIRGGLISLIDIEKN